MHLSIIVPFYNEEAGISSFFERLIPVLNSCTDSFKVICVDDGSTDNSFAALNKAKDTYGQLKLIRLSRNFGKEAALTAGLDHSEGRAVVMMDADLQHPPEVITEFLKEYKNGVDVVYGVRRSRQTDGAIRAFLARSFYNVFSSMGDVKISPDAGDFRFMSARAVAALQSLPERRRFMKGLYAWIGFSQKAVEYDVAERSNGQSRWSLAKLFSYAWGGILSFSTVPLKLWSVLGAALAALSGGYALYILIDTLANGRTTPGYATLATAIFFLGGVQLLSVGILGEYIARIFEETKARPTYIVEDIRDEDSHDEDMA